MGRRDRPPPAVENDPPPGLRYVADTAPGIRRRRAGRGFVYRLPDGSHVTDDRDLRRIRAIAVPPAWTDVWICRDARGHMQATGRDARGRKQYRYHAEWRAFRDETKFGRMARFGAALPVIRRRVAKDLSGRGLCRERALAAVVDLLDQTLIRVGNEEYARQNGSYGLTTLRDDHVEVNGTSLRFSFQAKSGRERVVDVRDRRLAALVKRMQDLPGHRLFRYLDDSEAPQEIDSGDVNAYLREVGGGDFSAKDFRTWGATAHVVERLLDAGPPPARAAQAEAEANVNDAIRTAAVRLGNTQAVTRRSYVHPLVVDAYRDGRLQAAAARLRAARRRRPAGLDEEEAVLLALLRSEARRARAAA